MTDQEKRIAIAEACGWRECHEALPGQFYGFARNHVWETQLPDYLNDLNAMAEATKVADNYIPVHTFNISDYVRHLAELVGAVVDDDPADTGDLFLLSNATARQRADAFLKTIGKLLLVSLALLVSCAPKPATKQAAPRMARIVEPPFIEHLPPKFVGVVITNPCTGDAEAMTSASISVPLSRKSDVSFTHLIVGNLSNGQPMFLMEITTPSSAAVGVEQSSDLQSWQSTGCLPNEPYWHSNEWGQVLLAFPADVPAKFFRVTTDHP